jgi:hypothetical protein
MNKFFLNILLLSALVISNIVECKETKVLVHVLSKDAKIIGSGVGGTLVTIKDIQTGKILSQGKQLGGTGDTNTIVREPNIRGSNRFESNSPANYTAMLDIDKPTIVEITAEGPLGFPQSIQKSSKTTLLLPGKHIDGEGIVLTIHGFIVDIMLPNSIDTVRQGEPFQVVSSIRMMCGCPTNPKGLWDCEKWDITAHMIKDDKIIQSAPMKFSGQTSIYETEFKAPNLQEGNSRQSIEIQVTCSDSTMANFGMDKTIINVVK